MFRRVRQQLPAKMRAPQSLHAADWPSTKSPIYLLVVAASKLKCSPAAGADKQIPETHEHMHTALLQYISVLRDISGACSNQRISKDVATCNFGQFRCVQCNDLMLNMAAFVCLKVLQLLRKPTLRRLSIHLSSHQHRIRPATNLVDIVDTLRMVTSTIILKAGARVAQPADMRLQSTPTGRKMIKAEFH